MAILVSAEEETIGEQLAKALKERMDPMLTNRQLECIGPAPAAIAKVRDIFHWTIYVKGESYRDLVLLRKDLEQYMEQEEAFLKGNVQFDFNPMQS